MNIVLGVLLWIAENLSWWWLLILAPGVAAWACIELWPTGKHRRPRGDRAEPMEAAAPAAVDDTLAFHPVAGPRGEADA